MKNPLPETSAAAFADTKPHYALLDGLRGVAALTVVWFHIFEAFATSHFDQRVNHGYLAVDFFFILSGFVVGYAYDERLRAGTLSVGGFFRRRLIRLQPLVVLGALIGGAMFYTQGCEFWDVSKISVAALLVATLMNALMIPAGTGTEIRGVTEMYPLNGPTWSLLFEYVGNVLYALVVRRLPTLALAALTVAAGIGLAAFALTAPWFGLAETAPGDVCVGFAMTPNNLAGGFLRLAFSFSAGLLIARIFRPLRVRGGVAFWVGAAAFVALAAFPRVGGEAAPWQNGLYDVLCCVVAFPLIVWLGASGKAGGRATARVCTFLGDISYPLYIVHYPFIYLYFAWVKNENLTFAQSLPGALALYFGCIALAWLALRLYDVPVRRWLSRLFRGGDIPVASSRAS